MSTPLQQEIGRTERVLDALLTERVLEGGPFGSVTESVVANILATASLTKTDLQGALAVRASDVDVALERMSNAGLVMVDGDRVTLSTSGLSALQAGRIKTSHVASRINQAITSADREATVRTLSAVRDIASRFRESGIPAG